MAAVFFKARKIVALKDADAIYSKVRKIIGLKSNSESCVVRQTLRRKEKWSPSVEIATLARLRSIYENLTLAQRAQLMAIVQCNYQELTAPVCESLAALELVRIDGDKYWNKYVATEDGRYVASLF